jgi:hypothetical protein
MSLLGKAVARLMNASDGGRIARYKRTPTVRVKIKITTIHRNTVFKDFRGIMSDLFLPISKI